MSREGVRRSGIEPGSARSEKVHRLRELDGPALARGRENGARK